MRDTNTAVRFVDDVTVGNMARAAFMAALMGAFAYVSFPYPFSPVPVTLQVLGVFLAGILLGPRWGAGAMILYLAAGAMGAPVFSFGQAGLGVLFGERVGYLLSFPIAAAVIGSIMHGWGDLRSLTRMSIPRLIIAMCAGIVVIYAMGVTGLILVLSLHPWEAFVVGAAIFLPAEAVKIGAALGIVRSDRLRVVTP